MENKFKILLVALGIAFIGLVVWVVKTTPDEPPPVEKVEPPKTVEYEGNTISEEKDGVKIWELTADKFTIGIATNIAEMQNIVGHFYQQDGRTIELHADTGTYYGENKNVHLKGHVIVTTSEGAKLTSDNLEWSSVDEIITATDKVKITRDDVFMSGDKAESKDGFRHFKLQGRVHIIKGANNEQ